MRATRPGRRARAANENLPINCVNWYEAYAFCIWDGGFLPSEAEWEYAAAGGSQQREYPWGAAAPGTANQYAIYGCYYPNGARHLHGRAEHRARRHRGAGAGLWGQLDLAGNVVQWNLDEYTFGYPCVDCATCPAEPPSTGKAPAAHRSPGVVDAPLDCVSTTRSSRRSVSRRGVLVASTP